MADPLKLTLAGLLLAGALGGVLYDPTPMRPIVYRGGYRVLEGDFHVHTTISDGSLTPLGVVRQAERRGLDVIAVTEHNTAQPGAIARQWARLRGGDTPIVLPGEEVTSKNFHVVAVGIRDTVSPSQPLDAVIAEIHLQHGIAIAAHPVKRYWPAFEPVKGALDGSEVMHPIAYSSGFGWRWEDLRTFYEANRSTLMPIGSSDYHWGSILGLCRTYVFVDVDPPLRAPTEDDVMAALRARRTVVIDREGHSYGDPALTALLDKQPIPARAADYRYRGEGAGDRILRVLGFIGLVGLVVFGRVRTRA